MSEGSVLAEEQRVGMMLDTEAYGVVSVHSGPMRHGNSHVRGEWFVHALDAVRGYEVPRDMSLKVVAQ